MILVSADDVGPVALGRMLRDGVLAFLSPRHAVPYDLPTSPDTRASTLAPVVPRHTIVSGLAGLWIRFGGSAPSVVDLVGRRGLHRAKPGADARGWRIEFHSGGAALEARDGVRSVAVARPERCAADALRWRDAREAIPAIYRAIRRGDVDAAALDAVVERDDPRGLGAARMRSTWAAIREALAP